MTTARAEVAEMPTSPEMIAHANNTRFEFDINRAAT
jgi:hypothetical protein